MSHRSNEELISRKRLRAGSSATKFSCFQKQSKPLSVTPVRPCVDALWHYSLYLFFHFYSLATNFDTFLTDLRLRMPRSGRWAAGSRR